MEKKSSDAISVVSKGRHLHFVKRSGWEFVQRPAVSGIVAIVAVTAQKKILLVEQFRPPVNASVIEIPSGLAGDTRHTEGEKLLKAAERELLEETGYTAGGWKQLFSGLSSAGVSSEVVTFFRASRLRCIAEGGGDEHEDIIVHEVSLRSVESWLRRKSAAGLLIDPKVYAGLYFQRSVR
jgi:ADP-ribose pyrophosphatase